MGEFRVAAIVSPDPSDLFFANQLINRVNVVGVIVENYLEETGGRSLLIKTFELRTQPIKFIKKIKQGKH